MATKKFGHEISYRGKELLTRLSSKQLVVCGGGALGSNLIDALCRQGFTKIRVIDMDRVEGHNVNTQLFGDGDVGALKVTALKNRVFRDTGVEIETFDKELNAGNIKKALKGADLVIDAFDNRASRLLVAQFCTGQKVPCIHGGMFEGYGEVVWNKDYTVPQEPPADAQDVCDYPLARNLVTFVVSVLAEEIADYCVTAKPRTTSWSITLKDLSVRRYR